MPDINASLLEWLNGPGPQYKVKDLLKMEAQEGQYGATYNIIYGADGKTPISLTNKLPVDVVFPDIQKSRPVDDNGNVLFLTTRPGSVNVIDSLPVGENKIGQVGISGIVKEEFSGSADVTKTFTSPMNEFAIINDGDSDLTFTINGITFTVKPEETFDDRFADFTQVAITTTVFFRALVRGDS